MSKKSCKKGYYWCRTDEKCKKVPKGWHVMSTGLLMRDSEHKDENKEETNGKKKNGNGNGANGNGNGNGGSDGGSNCLLYTSPSPRDKRQSRMPSSA